MTLAAAKEAKVATLNYGAFITTIIDFTIVAFCIFLVVKQMNRLKPPRPRAPAPKDCPQCAMSIPAAAKKCPHCASIL